MVIVKIFLLQIKDELLYTDMRSVIRWCMNNGVAIFCDDGSNRKYVIQSEYEMAKNRKVLNYLNNKNEVHFINTYFPMGKNEKSFLSTLLTEKAEL